MRKISTLKIIGSIFVVFIFFVGCLFFYSAVTAQSADIDKPATPLDPSAHTDIVIQYSPGNLDYIQITFTPPISGLDALKSTGLEIVTADYGFGEAVCSINGIGCPAIDCFCSSKFWGYYYFNGTDWIEHPVGSGSTTLNGGEIEGWIWSEYLEPLNVPPIPAVAHALDWLLEQQDSLTGGYGSSSSSNEVNLAIGSTGLSAEDWRKEVSGKSLLDYWKNNASAYSSIGAAEAGKLATGMIAARACRPAGTKSPLDYYNPDNGQFNSQSGFHIWAMLGTKAVNMTIPEAAITFLKNNTITESFGGETYTCWEWNDNFTCDSNTTALAVMALVAAGEDIGSTAILNGLDFLKACQQDDGGFTRDPKAITSGSDTNSTAYAIQAIYAVGQDPTSAAWQMDSHNPVEYLISNQDADGSFIWKEGYTGSKLQSTTQAISALNAKPYPIQTDYWMLCDGVHLPAIFK